MCIKPVEGPWDLLKQMDIVLVNQVEDQLVVQNAMVLTPVKAGGRPIGTTKLRGFGVGLRGGVYGAQSDDIKLPDEWDTSTSTETETVNINNYLLCKCASRIAQQRTFDSQPLAIGLYYSCG